MHSYKFSSKKYDRLSNQIRRLTKTNKKLENQLNNSIATNDYLIKALMESKKEIDMLKCELERGVK